MFGKKKKKEEKKDDLDFSPWPDAFPMSGAVYPPAQLSPSTFDQHGELRLTGDIVDPTFLRNYYSASGSYGDPTPFVQAVPPQRPAIDQIDVDALWEKMYKHAKAIFTVCDHCDRVGVLPQSVCEGCGAPLHYKFLE